MNPWDVSINFKDFILDLSFLSLFLLLGTALRRYVPFFQKYLIPNNILAGFLGLILGPQILGYIFKGFSFAEYSYVPLNSDRLGVYVYHILALTFIAMGLRKEKAHWGKGPLSTSLTGLFCFLGQTTIGLLVAFLLILTIKPDLFPGIGMLVTMGFGMGPGLAYSMGKSWEHFGFEGGGQVGLTFAAIGYLFAFFGGIWLIQWGIKHKKTKLINSVDDITSDIRLGVYKDAEPPSAGKLPLASEAIESMAFQVAMIGFVYLLTYFTVYLLTGWMESIGLHGFVSTVWSFHFIFAIIITLIVRKVLDWQKRSYVIDTGLMNRLAGVSIDYLVVSSIAAISVVVVAKYWLSILLMSILAGVYTALITYWAVYRAFDDYPFERFIGIFGEKTGTVNSGLVLIRVTDPEFKTNAAEDLIYGGAITIFLGLPLLIVMNFPMTMFNNSLRGYVITLGIFLAYWLILLIIWRAIGFLKFKKVLD